MINNQDHPMMSPKSIFVYHVINYMSRLTLAIRQFAIGESRSLLAKKKQEPSPIWLTLFFLFF